VFARKEGSGGGEEVGWVGIGGREGGGLHGAGGPPRGAVPVERGLGCPGGQCAPQRVHVVRYQQCQLQDLRLAQAEGEALGAGHAPLAVAMQHEHEVLLAAAERHHGAVRVAGNSGHGGVLQ